jgi:hypothetical protein
VNLVTQDAEARMRISGCFCGRRLRSLWASTSCRVWPDCIVFGALLGAVLVCVIYRTDDLINTVREFRETKRKIRLSNFRGRMRCQARGA